MILDGETLDFRVVIFRCDQELTAVVVRSLRSFLSSTCGATWMFGCIGVRRPG